MLSPLPAAEWSPSHAAHLLSRAGFGGTPDEIKALHSKGLDAAVKSLLDGDEDADLFPPPDWTADPYAFRREIRAKYTDKPTPEEKKEINGQINKENSRRLTGVRRDWITRMRYSPHPLREKLTLFWHGHFATSYQKVRDPYQMWLQNETFRADGRGHLGHLLKRVSRDPAMLRWLDVVQSKRGKPNENYARELLELFTLGEGHYTEEDIKEAARAFTGYRLDKESATARFVAKQHDDGEKTFLGERGAFAADDIVDIILEQKQCARFVGGRLWEFFAYDSPEPDLADAVAEEFRRRNYEIEPFLQTVFRSREFYSDRALRRQIKGPIQWMVQTCKVLEIDLPEPRVLDAALSQLGQVLFVPPNVAGWEGGRAWIGSSTIVLRYNLAGYLAGVAEKQITRLFNPNDRDVPSIQRIAPPQLRADRDALAAALVARLFGTADLPALRKLAAASLETASPEPTDAEIRKALHRLMSTPDYQLT